MRHLLDADRRASTLLLWASSFAAFGVLVVNSSWTPTLLAPLGLPVPRTAVALAFFNAGSVVATAAGGWLITRFGARRVLPAGFALAAIGMAGVGVLAPSAIGVAAMEVLIGLGLGGASSGVIALAATAYVTAMRSTGVGWAMGVGRIGSFVAIPVFPSRAFRHNGIYVHADSGIEKPSDLVGRTVGVPEYQLTANVWIRGILADRHDVPVASMRYRTGGMHQPGRVEKQKLNLPPEIDIARIPADRTLADMLVTGEIDALYAPRTPRPMTEGRPEVRRLFADPRGVEEQYAAETGIFPIMHVVVVRRDVYETRPWVARSLYAAFEQAKAATQERMGETAANSYMLPWLYDEVERTRRVLGPDFWPYGLDRNRDTLEVFLRYAHEQGLTARRLSPDELFAPETTETYVI